LRQLHKGTRGFSGTGRRRSQRHPDPDSGTGQTTTSGPTWCCCPRAVAPGGGEGLALRRGSAAPSLPSSRFGLGVERPIRVCFLRCTHGRFGGEQTAQTIDRIWQF
jgi:hypothetical protein